MYLRKFTAKLEAEEVDYEITAFLQKKPEVATNADIREAFILWTY